MAVQRKMKKSWRKRTKTVNTESRFSRRLRWSAAFAAFALCVLVGLTARAQNKKDYALIYGTVWNAQDRAVSGIPIKIQRIGDKHPKWELLSDHRGEFAQRVPTGDNEYLIIADIKVPKGGTKPQTKVHIYSNERVDISLHLEE